MVTGKTKKKKKNKAQLLEELKQKGVTTRGNREQLLTLCQQNGITEEEEIEIVKEGWFGKQKGMYQILWERGYLDLQKEYTVDGKKDEFGNVMVETSLRKLLMQQQDFVEEETLLQHHARNLGVEILRSPKCHPETAGEGIEYYWGSAKGLYRRLPIRDKRGKESFKRTVRKCLSPEQLTIRLARRFSRRARAYIMAHKYLDNKEEQDNNTPALSAYLIEKVVKKFKTHRCASDFDDGFINEVVREMRTHHMQN